MKLWTWFAIAALWFIIPQVLIYTGGLSVFVETGKHLSENGALMIASFSMNLMLWGWTIPLSIGVLRFAKKRLAN